MSDNKNKYFVVTNTTVVSAINKAEAEKAARSGRKVPGTQILSTESSADRVPAAAARSLANAS